MLRGSCLYYNIVYTLSLKEECLHIYALHQNYSIITTDVKTTLKTYMTIIKRLQTVLRVKNIDHALDYRIALQCTYV